MKASPAELGGRHKLTGIGGPLLAFEGPRHQLMAALLRFVRGNVSSLLAPCQRGGELI